MQMNPAKTQYRVGVAAPNSHELSINGRGQPGEQRRAGQPDVVEGEDRDCYGKAERQAESGARGIEKRSDSQRRPIRNR